MSATGLWSPPLIAALCTTAPRPNSTLSCISLTTVCQSTGGKLSDQQHARIKHLCRFQSIFELLGVNDRHDLIKLLRQFQSQLGADGHAVLAAALHHHLLGLGGQGDAGCVPWHFSHHHQVILCNFSYKTSNLTSFAVHLKSQWWWGRLAERWKILLVFLKSHHQWRQISLCNV